MKRGIISLLLSVIFLSCKAQGNPQIVNGLDDKPIPVRVLDWDRWSMTFVDNFFTEYTDTLIQQIGLDGIEEVKKHGRISGWPASFQYQVKFVKDTIARKDFYNRLSKLKVFKIASFNHIYQGKNWGPYVILKVPYKENVTIVKDSTWKENIDMYFLLEAAATKEILKRERQ